jgi:hypothetical protein
MTAAALPHHPLFAPAPTPAASSARFTAAYITAAGVAALAAPQPLADAVFGPGVLPTLWARVLGCLAATFGAYYAAVFVGDVEESKEGGKPSPVALSFYRSTVWARAALAAALAALAAAHRAPGLLLLAAANAVGAGAMAWALGRS